MANSPHRLLRIDQVEEIVGLKRAMIYRLIQRGTLPTGEVCALHGMYDSADAWLKAQQDQQKP